jgi:beta-galactosidase
MKRFLRFSLCSISALILGLLPCVALDQSPRDQNRIDDNWKFLLGDPADASSAGLDDSSWRTVTLPHDWSIEGKIDPKAPMGGGGGFFPAGIGWYRYHFDAPSSWKDKTVEVEFEGVYMNADVYLNGQKLTFHPYGYTSFFVDLTPALKLGATNVLAVRVDNSQQKNTRWYSGSGIYRHVVLIVTNPVQVAPWGVFVSVPKAESTEATINVQTEVTNNSTTIKTAKISTVLLGPDGKEMGRMESTVDLPPSGSQVVQQNTVIKNPPLWFPETPQLSKVETTVKVDGQTVDQVSTPFGVRALAWSADKGLTLNGKTYKLSGGCIHDDNGVLGACAFDRAEERKIALLKAAGFNAIRTAHNPPSPELLDACDRLGMLVMDEAFDCWAIGKNKDDYSVVFKDWWQRDIDSMIKRDRNHPSVVLWSIGNEIPGIYTDMGGEYGPKLAGEIHSLDKTRPVTNGILGWPSDPKKPTPDDAVKQKNADLNWNSLDIVGTNYNLGHHTAQHAQFPDRIVVSTESSPPVGPAFQVLDNPYVVGDFVWSAQDYLGECGVGRWFYEGDPTEPVSPPRNPGDTAIHPVMHGSDSLYPWHGANPGNLDLLGNRKPAAHLRNIMWDQGEKLYLAVRQPEDDKKVIVVGWGWFPTWESWTWPGREGKPMTVDVYSRYEKVRLYLNDKLIDEKPTTRGQNFQASFTLPYQPGKLKAVGVENGQEVGDAELHTVGDPSAIRLTPDRSTINADGQDLSFIEVEVVDKDGQLQPNADELISFTLTGPGTIAGLGSANLKGEEPYQGTQCHVFHGKALIVLRGSKEAGALQLKAEATGLAPGQTEITCK